MFMLAQFVFVANIAAHTSTCTYLFHCRAAPHISANTNLDMAAEPKRHQALP